MIDARANVSIPRTALRLDKSGLSFNDCWHRISKIAIISSRHKSCIDRQKWCFIGQKVVFFFNVSTLLSLTTSYTRAIVALFPIKPVSDPTVNPLTQ